MMLVRIWERLYFILAAVVSFPSGQHVDAYHRQPCSWSIRKQFQYDDCFIPRLDPDLPLSEANFLLSHDAVTGYLSSYVGPIHSAINLYAKTQKGTITDQLQNGARAFDLRLHYLQNETIIFHHGAVIVPIKLETVLQEVKAWSSSNSEELVLLFHSHATYQFSNISRYADGQPVFVNALKTLYGNMGINYLACGDVYGWTVGDAMEAGTISSTGGSVIALDYRDTSLSMCAKMNWVENRLVTCYPSKAPSSTTASASSQQDASSTNSTTTSILPCTKTGTLTHQWLLDYMAESATGATSDDSSILGPPASLNRYPFNEVQAMWQIDAHAAATGIAHFSSLIDDTTKSNIHKDIVEWVHGGQIGSPLSLLAVDYVTLHGNALLSVLRTQCGQSDQVDEKYCGSALALPRVYKQRFSTMSWFLTIVVFGISVGWIWVIVRHYFRHYQHERQMERLSKDMEYVTEALQCDGSRFT